MPRPIRGLSADLVLIDDMSFWPDADEPRRRSAPPHRRPMLEVQERNGRWHVYETSVHPWALVTAFRTEDEARAYVELGRVHAGACDVYVGGWSPEVLQESRRCMVCDRSLSSGTEVHLRSIRVVSDGTKTDTKYEAKCLEHTRTRFNRDEPL